MNSWSMTDKGIVRRQNQDSYFSYCDDARAFALFIVCDGMGGHAGGATASALAVDYISDAVLSRYDGTEKTPEALSALLRETAEEANAIVFRKSVEEPSLRGMGTTIVAAIVTSENAVVLNVGDSRAYHLTENGITQITKDHSVVEEMIARGEITREQSRENPRKNLITRALGTEPGIRCDFFYPNIESGDRLLLCTDGLSNLFTDNELFDAAFSADDLEVCCESLLRQTLARGAPDNITITLFSK